jgi:hypothetical protein
MPRVQRVTRPVQAPRPSIADMSAAGLRAFFSIANDWTLSADEQIVLLERLSLILGIYKALQILLPQPEAADGWIKRANTAPPFGGRRALDRMLAGNVSDLVAVRQYLDAMRGGWA